jgi:hypothetical protein
MRRFEVVAGEKNCGEERWGKGVFKTDIFQENVGRFY